VLAALALTSTPAGGYRRRSKRLPPRAPGKPATLRLLTGLRRLAARELLPNYYRCEALRRNDLSEVVPAQLGLE
jgi:hypothetical protein